MSPCILQVVKTVLSPIPSFISRSRLWRGPCTSDICVYDYLVLIIIYVLMDVLDVKFSWLKIYVIDPPLKENCPPVSSPCPVRFSPLLRIRHRSPIALQSYLKTLKLNEYIIWVMLHKGNLHTRLKFYQGSLRIILDGSPHQPIF